MAAIIMALGIGANTAIFSVVNKVLLEPLPFRDADRIVQIWHTPPQSSFPGMTTFAISPANFLDWQKENHVFDKMALYSGAHFDITGAGKPEAIGVGTVTPDFFSALGAEPLHGRVFRAEENNPGQNHEVILSYKFWQAREQIDSINRMIVWLAAEEIVSWRGELKEEWFACLDSPPEDAWDESRSEGRGEFEPLEGPEMLDESQFPIGRPYPRR
jgi:hypothetical protein